MQIPLAQVLVMAAQSENESRLFTLLICMLAVIFGGRALLRALAEIRRMGPHGRPLQRLWLTQTAADMALPLSANVRIGSAHDGAHIVVPDAKCLLVDIVVGSHGPVAVPLEPGSLALNGRPVKGSVVLCRGDQLAIRGLTFEISDRWPR